MAKEKVVIGWPSGGSVHHLFPEALLALQAFELLSPSDDYEVVQYSGRAGLYVQENRNKLVKALLNSEADWLLQVDSDESFKPEILRILMRTADAKERPIISGLYSNVGDVDAGGAFQVLNCVYKEADDGRYIAVNVPENLQPFEVAAAGSGILLVHRRVFETLEYPWFWLDLFENPDGTTQMMNEDLGFCRAARLAGFPIWCDPLAEVCHWKTLPLTPSSVRDYLVQTDKVFTEMKADAVRSKE